MHRKVHLHICTATLAQSTDPDTFSDGLLGVIRSTSSCVLAPVKMLQSSPQWRLPLPAETALNNEHLSLHLRSVPADFIASAGLLAAPEHHSDLVRSPMAPHTRNATIGSRQPPQTAHLLLLSRISLQLRHAHNIECLIVRSGKIDLRARSGPISLMHSLKSCAEMHVFCPADMPL